MNAMADKFFDSIKGKKLLYRNRYKQSSAYKTFC